MVRARAALARVRASREAACPHRASPNRRYLSSNLAIAALVILLVSADLADPLRFKQVWRTHVSERKRLVAAARGEPTMGTFQYLLLTFQSNVMYKQCEVVITYVLQTVCTMISTRTIIFTEATDDGSVKESFTKTCNESIGNYPGLERTNAVLICLLTWVVMLTFMPLLLAAFAHSIGPAPPISKEKLKVRALPLARFVAPPLTESRGSLISGGEGEEPARD